MAKRDPTQNALVHKTDGGNTLVVESGGQIILMPGAKIGPNGSTVALPIASASQAAVVTTAPTNVSPYGFSQAQAAALITLVNELRADLIAAGIIKGSA